ncbi:hypothetical protein CXB51_006622 [Gossypium anomalum]|uniref:Agglutinin domain-containing protein n=1 Tax=Gossypium anomalum TaxID=47600 RepID=A0A8J5ZDV8_9ROSI|nr:hypothetical protein CXB51_006622 [Gossypium anomalum]
MSFAAPRFMVLKSNKEYLGIIDGNGAGDGYLKFSSETQATSSCAKFEVEEAAAGHGLVHIRSCRNNKYWERVRNNPTEDGQYWIAATAKKREEDQSRDSCTLFKLIPMGTATTDTVRIMHVQSKCRLCLSTSGCVLANSNAGSDDIFTIINRESLLDFPRYVAFKGDNTHYLRLHHMERHPFLQFSSSNISDPNVTMELFVNNDGMLRINTIVFINCLDACIPAITQEAQLLAEEPVKARHIQGIQYNLDNLRMVEESVMVMAKHTYENCSMHPQHYDVKCCLQDTTTRTWNTNFSFKLGGKATFDVHLPLVVDGKADVSSELHGGYEFGRIYTHTSNMEYTHKVEVPPMTKVTVNLVATIATYDIPFTYLQKDTLLYNNTTVKYDVQCGTLHWF